MKFHPNHIASCALAFVCLWPLANAALAAAPPAIVALLPASVGPVDGNWSDAGSMTTGDFRANIRGIEPTCDITVGSQIRLHLKNAYGLSDPLIAMLQQQQGQTVMQVKTGMEAAAILKRKDQRVTATSEVKLETIGNGKIVYWEYTENCPSHPNHRNTVLRGFSRNGKVFSAFELTLTARLDEARALGTEILTKLQSFTPPPVAK